MMRRNLRSMEAFPFFIYTPIGLNIIATPPRSSSWRGSVASLNYVLLRVTISAPARARHLDPLTYCRANERNHDIGELTLIRGNGKFGQCGDSPLWYTRSRCRIVEWSVKFINPVRRFFNMPARSAIFLNQVSLRSVR